MKVNKLDHFNIETAKPDQTVHFYADVLGLTNAPEARPSTDIPGTWILIEDHPAIHINFVSTDQTGATGAIDHLAFDASGHKAYEASFKKNNIQYQKVERPEINLIQLYVKDPNGIKIEMNIRGEL